MARIKILWLGHAGFRITSPGGKVIFIDAWLTDCPTARTSVNEIDRADLVLVTHDHFDHIGDALEITKKTGATLVANVETARKLEAEGVPADQIINAGRGMNIGGASRVGNIEIIMTQAFHSSATGAPVGYVIRMEDGGTIYHAGDTGIFGTMKVLADLYGIDIALLPIGSTFTMDPVQAAYALTLLKPKIAIPMHYATFPVIEPNPDRFVEEARKRAPHVEIRIMNPGEEEEIEL